MIDYCIKMPEKEDYQKGHRYPYYSCELLCSKIGFNIDKLLKTPIEPNNNLEPKEHNCDEKEENEEKIDNKQNKEDISDKEMENKKDENNIISEVKKDDDITTEENENSEKKEKIETNEEQKDINLDGVEEKQIDEIMDIENDESEIDNKNKKEEKNEELNFPLVYSILDHFFSFLEDKTSLENDVLMGYFNKITNYLLKTKTKIVLDYILINRENIINQLFSHINKYSIANIIINILYALTDDKNEETNGKYMIIINKLIEQLEINENDDTIEIICDLFINCVIYNNKIKFPKILEENIINKFENIMQKYIENHEQNKNKIFFVINLLTKMNKSILSNFSKKITNTINSDDNTNEMLNLIKLADRINIQYISLFNRDSDYKGFINDTFLNEFRRFCNSIGNISITIIKDLIQQGQNQEINEEEFENSFSSKKCKKLGIQKITKLEYIKTVLDIYINCLSIFGDDAEKKNFLNEKIHLISETKIFKLFIEYYFNYKNNNFFTNIMLDLVNIIFDNDKAPEELIISFLQLNDERNNFINLLINDLVKNTKYTFENSSNKMNNFIFGSNITILNSIFSSKNIYMNNILNEKMPKEKFFYDNFITNIYSIFSKRLYKTEEKTERPEFDLLGVRLNILTNTQGALDIPFSLESLDDTIAFYLKVYQKYLDGEEYDSLFRERENKLEEIRKSNQYIRLGNQIKDEESETEEEDDEYDDVDIPKPMFFNSSQLEERKVEQSIKDENIDTQKYNDINFWHTDIKDENMEEILKELL